MEFAAYTALYIIIGWFAARIAMALALLCCVSISMEDPRWKDDAGSRFFVSRCMTLLRKISFCPLKVNNRLAAPMAATGFYLSFSLLLIHVFNSPPGFAVFCILFFLAVDALVDLMTEILPDLTAFLIGALLFWQNVQSGANFAGMFPWMIAFCALLILAWFFGRGRGDIKLLLAMNIGGGPVFALITICGAFLAMLCAERSFGREKPLAPWLCVGASLALAFAPHLEKIMFLN